MFKSKYIILEGRDPSDFNTSAGGPLNILEEEIDYPDYVERKKDPKIVAMAPEMPIKLIEPTTIDDITPSSMEDCTWGIRAIKADTSKYDGEGIVVAVLDTGIELSHPIFSGMNIVRKNFTDEVDDDVNGHGTHCAGTIFGRDVNGKRIGVARNIGKALIGKVLGNGGRSTLTLVQALNWAIEQGANIISMSLGIDFPGYVAKQVKEGGIEIEPATSIALQAYQSNVDLFSKFVDYVKTRSKFGEGTLIIAASGNESRRPKYKISVAPPAAGQGIISVGALQNLGAGVSVASFSNYNVDIAAPGVKIESATLDGKYKSSSGTSMATPHVAGAAALWADYLSKTLGKIDVEILRSKLLESGTTAHLIGEYDTADVGRGMVQTP